MNISSGNLPNSYKRYTPIIISALHMGQLENWSVSVTWPRSPRRHVGPSGCDWPFSSLSVHRMKRIPPNKLAGLLLSRRTLVRKTGRTQLKALPGRGEWWRPARLRSQSDLSPMVLLTLRCHCFSWLVVCPTKCMHRLCHAPCEGARNN